MSTYDKNKQAMYRRDNWRCRHCNSSHNLTPHHIVFQSQGGTDDLDNLVTLCIVCHNAVHDGNLSVKTMDLFIRKNGWKP
jgi:5-methylcytosine-specific restriction endonuclease McrA